MVHEISIYGIFLPDILVWAILAYFVSVPVRYTFSLLGLYHLFWHRALVNVCLYIILLGAIVVVIERLS